MMKLKVHHVDIMRLVGRREEVPSGRSEIGLAHKPDLVQCKQDHEGAKGNGEDILEFHPRGCVVVWRTMSTTNVILA